MQELFLRVWKIALVLMHCGCGVQENSVNESISTDIEDPDPPITHHILLFDDSGSDEGDNYEPMHPGTPLGSYIVTDSDSDEEHPEYFIRHRNGFYLNDNPHRE